MISPTLLGKVLDCDIISCNISPNSPYTYLHYRTSSSTNDTINIHELANKCKKWAHLNGHNLVSEVFMSDGKEQGLCMHHKDVNKDYVNVRTANSEPQAIIKACEYIEKEL